MAYNSTSYSVEGYIYASSSSYGSVHCYAYCYQDPVANKSKVTFRGVYFDNDTGMKNGYFYASGSAKLGSQTITYSGSGRESRAGHTDTGNFIGSYQELEFEVSHGSTGLASVTFTANMTLTSEADSSVSRTFNGSVSISLHQIDRTAASITLAATPVSESSVSITASSDQTCNEWQYKLDSLGWVTFSSDTGTSATHTITGMSAGRHTVQVRASRVYNEVVGESSTVSFETTLPSVTARLSSPTYNSLVLSASANTSCDLWEYSLDAGSTWTSFSTTNSASASTTLTSLSPGTTYSVIVRARKTSNGLKGTSSSVSASTNGGSVLSNVATAAVDVTSPSTTITATVKESLYHRLYFYMADGTTQVCYINLGVLATGSGKTYTVSLQSKRSTLLAKFPSAKNYTFKVVLKSYTNSGYSTLVGSSGPKSFKATTSSDVSKPTAGTFTYSDTNSDTTAITANNQVLISAASTLRVIASAGTAKNSATITGYSVSIGDVSVTGDSRTIDAGVVSSHGDLTLRVTWIDSRGYSSYAETNVTVLQYSKPSFSMLNLRRRNEIDDIVQLYFNGSVSSITVNGVEKNRIVSISFRWKLSSADDSEYVTVDLTNASELTINGLSFSYSNAELMTLNELNSYKFQFYVYDALGDSTVYTITKTLGQGTPAISIRKKTNTLPQRVGINNPTPTYDLDVVGNISMNHVRVMGYFGALTTQSLTSATFRKGGFVLQENAENATSARGYPVASAGILEIISSQTGYTIQRYTPFDLSAVYIRTYNGTAWTQWKTITLT